MPLIDLRQVVSAVCVYLWIFELLLLILLYTKYTSNQTRLAKRRCLAGKTLELVLVDFPAAFDDTGGSKTRSACQLHKVGRAHIRFPHRCKDWTWTGLLGWSALPTHRCLKQYTFQVSRYHVYVYIYIYIRYIYIYIIIIYPLHMCIYIHRLIC